MAPPDSLIRQAYSCASASRILMDNCGFLDSANLVFTPAMMISTGVPESCASFSVLIFSSITFGESPQKSVHMLTMPGSQHACASNLSGRLRLIIFQDQTKRGCGVADGAKIGEMGFATGLDSDAELEWIVSRSGWWIGPFDEDAGFD